MERSENGQQADAEDEDRLEGVFGKEIGDAGSEGDDGDGEEKAESEVGEVVAAEEPEEELAVVILYLDGGIFHGLVILEIGHEKAQRALADDDDEEEVERTHQGAVGRHEDVGGIVHTEGYLERGEVCVASGVESCEHAAHMGKEGGVALSVEQEADGDGDGAAQQSEEGGLDEAGGKPCPGTQVGREQQQGNSKRNGCRRDGGLQGVHFLGVGDDACETECAT